MSEQNLAVCTSCGDTFNRRESGSDDTCEHCTLFYKQGQEHVVGGLLPSNFERVVKALRRARNRWPKVQVMQLVADASKHTNWDGEAPASNREVADMLEQYLDEQP